MSYIHEDVDQDQIEVHWQHPRTELELPLLLVWPHPVVDEWAAVVENGVATVVCHEWLVDASDDPDTEDIEKRAEEWDRDEAIPRCVAEALLDYEGQYGPVETVANPYPDDSDGDSEPEIDPAQATLAGVSRRD